MLIHAINADFSETFLHTVATDNSVQHGVDVQQLLQQ